MVNSILREEDQGSFHIGEQLIMKIKLGSIVQLVSSNDQQSWTVTKIGSGKRYAGSDRKEVFEGELLLQSGNTVMAVVTGSVQLVRRGK